MGPPSGDFGVGELVRLLKMTRHAKGGWVSPTQALPHLASAYHLLEVGDVAPWRRLEADQVWHWCAGGPLVITTSQDGAGAHSTTIGPDLRHGQRPQTAVAAGWWRTAESLGAWTLVALTTAPPHDDAQIDWAPADWRPTP